MGNGCFEICSFCQLYGVGVAVGVVAQVALEVVPLGKGAGHAGPSLGHILEMGGGCPATSTPLNRRRGGWLTWGIR